jgi:hypothetical protein
MMTRQTRKRILLAASAALTAAIVLTAALAMLPLDTPAVGGGVKVGGGAPRVAGGELRPANAYAEIGQRNLRQPLHDEPPPAPPVAPVVAPSAVLTGTIIDNDPAFCYGMFRLANGESKMVGVGETIEGMEIISVGAHSIQAKLNGQVIVVPVLKEGTTP